MSRDAKVDRVAVPVVAFTLPIGIAMFVVACAAQPTKTVNVERTTTNTVVVPKSVPCIKQVDLLPVPVRIAVDAEGATTDQLAAAAAADREAFSLYATAVASILAQCSEGAPK